MGKRAREPKLLILGFFLTNKEIKGKRIKYRKIKDENKKTINTW